MGQTALKRSNDFISVLNITLYVQAVESANKKGKGLNWEREWGSYELSSQHGCAYFTLASFPGLRGGGGKAWYALFAHAR